MKYYCRKCEKKYEVEKDRRFRYITAQIMMLGTATFLCDKCFKEKNGKKNKKR